MKVDRHHDPVEALEDELLYEIEGIAKVKYDLTPYGIFD